MKAKKKINIAIDGTSITFNDEGELQAAVSGGLDCASLDALPEKPWVKGTKVLAKQGDDCVMLKASGDIFTDVMLSMSMEKTSTSIVTGTDETINLVAQVQNAGTNPATAIRLVLTKPALGTYTMGTPVTQSQGATNFVKVSDTEYTIETLSSGGTATVTIPVTYSKSGTFTFGGQVTSTIDTDTKNNSKTVTISVTEQATATGGNYVPTQDCPLFTITDLQYNKQLSTFGGDTPNNTYTLFVSGVNKYNIYADKRGLAGRRFRLENVEQIICVSSCRRFYYGESSGSATKGAYGVCSRGGAFTISSSSEAVDHSSSFSSLDKIAFQREFDIHYPTDLFSQPGQFIIPTSAYSYNKQTGELVFNDSFTHDFKRVVNATNVGVLVIYVRPSGLNCKWQCCAIKFGARFEETVINTSGIVHSSNLGDNVTFEYLHSYSVTTEADLDKKANWVIGEAPSDLLVFKEKPLSLGVSTPITTNNSVVVNIKKGTNGTFTLTATDNRLANVQTQGNINTSYNADSKTLTVTLANPQPQNSIVFPNVEFKVID